MQVVCLARKKLNLGVTKGWNGGLANEAQFQNNGSGGRSGNRVGVLWVVIFFVFYFF